MRKLRKNGGFQGESTLPFSARSIQNLETNDDNWLHFQETVVPYDIDSVFSLFQNLEEIRKNNPTRSLWFRGQKKAEYGLVPSCFRDSAWVATGAPGQAIRRWKYAGNFNYRKISGRVTKPLEN